jgi:hypothetical protein
MEDVAKSNDKKRRGPEDIRLESQHESMRR